MGRLDLSFFSVFLVWLIQRRDNCKGSWYGVQSKKTSLEKGTKWKGRAEGRKVKGSREWFVEKKRSLKKGGFV